MCRCTEACVGRGERGEGRRETGDGRRETGEGRGERGHGGWENGDPAQERPQTPSRVSECRVLCSLEVQMRAIVDPGHVIQFPATPDAALVDVMMKCLHRDPSKRPTITGPTGLLNHPFLHPERLSSMVRLRPCLVCPHSAHPLTTHSSPPCPSQLTPLPLSHLCTSP